MNDCEFKPIRIGEVNKTRQDSEMLETILNKLKRGQIRDDHPLQRNADMWDSTMRDNFISTVIKGEDVDSVKMCEEISENVSEIWLIDGKQRLTNARNFKLNAFKLGKSVENPIIEYKEYQKDKNGNAIKSSSGKCIFKYVQYDLRGKYYKDLPEELKEAFNSYKVNTVLHTDCTPADVAYHIRRYNRQRSFNSSQNAVTYMDDIAKDIKELSRHNFIRDYTALSPIQKNNGTSEKFVLESLMAINFLDEWKKSPKSQAKFLNERCTKKNLDDMRNLFNRLNNIIDDDTQKVFTSKSGFLFVTLFEKFTRLGIDDKGFNEFLLALHGTMSNVLVDEHTWTEINAQRSTKDKGIVEEKLHILNKLMMMFFEKTTSNGSREDNTEALKFVQENVNQDLIMVDIETYMADLKQYVKKFKGTKLLERKNKNSLLAIVAYSYLIDVEPTEWFDTYFKNNSTYIADQKENYLHMKEELNNFYNIKESEEFEDGLYEAG